MKHIITVIFALTATYGNGCPNLNGEYQFERPWNGSITLTQRGCDEISILFKKPDAKPFTETYKTDGLAYDGFYNYGARAIPATQDESPFYRAQYTPDGLSLKTFQGAQRKCGNNYVFEVSDCKMLENAIRYDQASGRYLWTQTGYISTPQDYSVDTFSMTKIR